MRRGTSTESFDAFLDMARGVVDTDRSIEGRFWTCLSSFSSAAMLYARKLEGDQMRKSVVFFAPCNENQQSASKFDSKKIYGQ